MLCQKCQQREATCHTTAVSGDVAQRSDLCEACFNESASSEIREMTKATRDAHCQYCGGSPCCGGTDTLAMILGIHQMNFMCMSCAMEHNRFIRAQSEHCSQDSSQEEQMATIKNIMDTVDAHMKQWVSERD
jgi:protein-arginine kinase activator protein McsA